MYTVWHVDKYKITFKLVIDHWPRARRLRNTVLWNPKVHCRVNWSPPLGPILTLMNSVQTLIITTTTGGGGGGGKPE
jgi:hypothetical protein